MNRYCAIPNINAASYAGHSLHSENCDWVEKNCYVDSLIEVIHALGAEPHAMLPFILTVDFVGDQWTFFKPQHKELRYLYGLDIQEMSCWRPLLDHAVEHLASQRLINVEVDSYWLPDTAATDYRRNHVKTAVVLTDIDAENQRLGYFHNSGYFELSGEDFRQIFRIDVAPDPSYLPLYAELIHINQVKLLDKEELARLSSNLLRQHISLIPQDNPIKPFAKRFERELPTMHEHGLAYYHLWAFNNTRQLGAAFELAAAYLRWLMQYNKLDMMPAIESFQKISRANKSLILKIARSVNANRPLDLTELFAEMAGDWDRGMNCLVDNLKT
jgi:hypothetical protein